MHPSELSYVNPLIRMSENIIENGKFTLPYYRKGSDYRFSMYNHGVNDNWKLNFVIFSIWRDDYFKEKYNAKLEYECNTKKDIEWIVDTINETDSFAKLEMHIARREVETKLEAM